MSIYVDEMKVKTDLAHKYAYAANTPQENLSFPIGQNLARQAGFDASFLDKLPEGLVESFTGVANPHPYLDIHKGETILDLGCGAGLDTYLCAKALNGTGKVFGVDLCYEMIEKAQVNMEKLGMADCTEFLWAAADAIPVHSESIDLVIANGIFNDAPNDQSIFYEISRILKPKGRLVVCETFYDTNIVDSLSQSRQCSFRCSSGKIIADKFLQALRFYGFKMPSFVYKEHDKIFNNPSAFQAVIKAYISKERK